MRCIVCGNNIKDNSLECPVCGTKQLGIPVYNTQQYTDLQHQINNMHINNDYNSQIPTPYKTRYDVKKTKSKDIVSLIMSIIGIYYSLNVLIIIADGVQKFINEYLNDPKYAEILTSPLTTAVSMTWPLFLLPIIGIIFGFAGRRVEISKMNTFSIIASVSVLAVGIASTYYIYTQII